MNREDIYAALYQKVSAIPGLVITSRRLRHWADVPGEQQPALYQAQGGETPITTSGQPSAWLLRCSLYLYVQVASDDAPGPVLNPLMDAICNAINEVHPITGRAVLPGVEGVEYCRINGSIETDEGALGNQAVAIIPVEILAA